MASCRPHLVGPPTRPAQGAHSRMSLVPARNRCKSMKRSPWTGGLFRPPPSSHPIHDCRLFLQGPAAGMRRKLTEALCDSPGQPGAHTRTTHSLTLSLSHSLSLSLSLFPPLQPARGRRTHPSFTKPRDREQRCCAQATASFAVLCPATVTSVARVGPQPPLSSLHM